MGFGDEGISEDDELHDIAVEVAVKAGLLERCPLHDEEYDPQNDEYQAAYKLANALVTKGVPLVAPFKGSRRKLTDLLATICDGFNTHCPSCERNASRD